MIKAQRWDNTFGAIAFEDKAKFIPLQGADLLTGVGNQWVDKKIVRGLAGPEDKLLANLTAAKQITMARYDEHALLKFRDRWKGLDSVLTSAG